MQLEHADKAGTKHVDRQIDRQTGQSGGHDGRADRSQLWVSHGPVTVRPPSSVDYRSQAVKREPVAWDGERGKWERDRGCVECRREEGRQRGRGESETECAGAKQHIKREKRVRQKH